MDRVSARRHPGPGDKFACRVCVSGTSISAFLCQYFTRDVLQSFSNNPSYRDDCIEDKPVQSIRYVELMQIQLLPSNTMDSNHLQDYRLFRVECVRYARLAIDSNQPHLAPTVALHSQTVSSRSHSYHQSMIHGGHICRLISLLHIGSGEICQDSSALYNTYQSKSCVYDDSRPGLHVTALVYVFFQEATLCIGAHPCPST